MKIDEYYGSWEHMHGILIPITEEFSADTTLMVFLLNPATPTYQLPDHARNILREKGYTRLYVFYLFSYVGDLSEVSEPSLETLVSQKSNEILRTIIPDVKKFFLAYGENADQKLKELLQQRIAEVKQTITDIKGEALFFTFGELSDSGNPKRIEELQSDDEEIPLL